MTAMTAERYERLRINPWFGCLSRVALEIELEDLPDGEYELVYFDVDNLKRANESWGKPESSLRIRDSVRGHDLLGNWFSGDEFAMVVAAGDGVGAARRLLRELRSRGMSATFVVTGYRGPADIDVAEELIGVVKCRVKGCVIDLTDGSELRGAL